ncbi:MAG: hypothetical protein WC596_00400 [Candidatus Shapirobacteria bacterium]
MPTIRESELHNTHPFLRVIKQNPSGENSCFCLIRPYEPCTEITGGKQFPGSSTKPNSENLILSKSDSCLVCPIYRKEKAKPIAVTAADVVARYPFHISNFDGRRGGCFLQKSNYEFCLIDGYSYRSLSLEDTLVVTDFVGSPHSCTECRKNPFPNALFNLDSDKVRCNLSGNVCPEATNVDHGLDGSIIQLDRNLTHSCSDCPVQRKIDKAKAKPLRGSLAQS